MFHIGETVRSQFWGLARVVEGGEDPTIEPIGGAEHKVSGSDLVRIPRQQYADAVVNLECVERFLDLCIYGHTTRHRTLPEKFDAPPAIASFPAEGPPDDPAMLFIMDDLYEDVADGNKYDATPTSQPVQRVAVRRVEPTGA